MRILLLVALLLAPAAAGELDKKAFGKLRKALPKYLWQPKRRAKIEKLWAERRYDEAVLTKDQFAAVAKILRAGSPYTTQKKRSLTLDVPTGTEGETMPVKVAVTTKYKPGCGRSFPLIITCHGGPCSKLQSAVSGSSTQFRLWQSYTSTLECIVAAPALTGSGYGEREWTFLKNLIDELDRRYNVDRDQVLLTGHSWGGILTWFVGPPHADTFALLAPFICATNPGRSHLANCAALPIYQVQGNKDHKWMLDSGRARKKILDELGYEHTYREMNGGHVAFRGEVARIAKLLAKTRRNMYAERIVRRHGRSGGNESDRWYWISTPARSFEARYDSKKRLFEVGVSGAFEVFLSDDMLDLDGPITIKREGDVVFFGRVERKLAFLLAHLKRTGDRAAIFAASIKVAG